MENINKSLYGVNFCAFSFGAIGSGKTYSTGTNYHKTMLSVEMGFLPMSVFHIFDQINKLKEKATFKMKVSFIEIQNEEIRDLLNPKK